MRFIDNEWSPVFAEARVIDHPGSEQLTGLCAMGAIYWQKQP